MFDNSHLVDLIERELDDHPYCPVCSAPTTIEEGEAGRLWLVCSTAVDPQGSSPGSAPRCCRTSGV